MKNITSSVHNTFNNCNSAVGFCMGVIVFYSIDIKNIQIHTLLNTFLKISAVKQVFNIFRV